MPETERQNPSNVAVVTGAGSGIGRAIALELAGAGFSLALIGRRREPLEEVATLAAREGSPAAKVYAYDLAETDGIASLIDSIHHEMGGPAVLVNNAGIFVEKPFKECSLEDFRASFDTNLFSAIELVRAAVPYIEQGVEAGHHGAVIFIGSRAAERGYATGSIYSATKHALRGFADSLYYDLQESGIRVAIVEPGVVNTSVHEAGGRYDPSAMIQPEDIAKTVRFVLELPNTACPFLIQVRPERDPRVGKKANSSVASYRGGK